MFAAHREVMIRSRSTSLLMAIVTVGKGRQNVFEWLGQTLSVRVG